MRLFGLMGDWLHISSPITMEMITTTRIRPIQKGASTHTQGQLMTPQSLRTTKATPSRPIAPTPDDDGGVVLLISQSISCSRPYPTAARMVMVAPTSRAVKLMCRVLTV